MQGFTRLPALLFAFLWSTGFPASRLSVIDAPAMTILSIRFAIVAGVLILLSKLFAVDWSRVRKGWRRAGMVGILLNSGYLGGVFLAVQHGMSAGVAAAIVGLQPILMIIGARFWLGEPLSKRQWLGVICGWIGVMWLVGERTNLFAGSGEASLLSIIFIIMALMGICFGTLIQKRHPADLSLYELVMVQYIAATISSAVLMLLFGVGEVIWTMRFLVTLTWQVLVLSLGAVMIFMWLLKKNAATHVSSMLYLIPPLVVLEEMILFGDPISWGNGAAIGIVCCGVMLVMTKEKAA
ncbi:MAG: DMT family transporter [Pseudomonadota bacterium]